MPTIIVFHEVEDGARWANAWKEGEGSRHEMFDRIGVRTRTFRDPDDPNSTGVVAEVSDLDKFYEFMGTDEVKRAMEEDGLKVDTMRILHEFTP